MINPITYYNGYITLNFNSIYSLDIFDKNIIKYILDDVEERCGNDYIHTTHITRPTLRREITDIYYNQTLNSPLKNFYKSWFQTRLDRAHARKEIIETPIFYRYGSGFLLFDLINNTYKEQNYFRISNAYLRYKNNCFIIIKQLLKNKVPEHIIKYILSFIHIDLSYQIFADTINTNIKLLLK